ncbi:SWIM zinc finger-containing protein [Frankia sp. QA3]|uniref:SWIM zinc finger-containing protein n=1 Tax=Frankia sp. QA3 TaxID=710111 RepID=UPI000269BBCF|nr:SWIM zinc finger-containing protein [Frankia sp. QA3]EIV92160.1 SWIM zinc finger-containing protein [Frankia sp. QA3]
MTSNDFGYLMWGRDWVRFAEPLRQTRPDPQLPRARRMARDGKVQVTIDGGIVRAVVEHGRKPSVVTIEVAPMSREAIVEISRRLSGVQLALTDELYRAITDAGHPPAPALAGVDCSCPADTSRCIHVLAVYYAMAQRVDDDPRVTLDVQGYFRTSSESAEAFTAATPRRWIALNALNPADYFVVAE